MPIFVLGGSSSPPFWESLVAPGITFAGTLVVVFLTNHFASKNLRQQRELDEKRLREQWQREDEKQWGQRKHETAEAIKERISQKRREICLQGVDAFARYQAHVATYATNFDDFDHKPFQDFVAKASQVELVVEPEAAQAVRELVSAIGLMHMKLMTRRIPLHKLHMSLRQYRQFQKDGTNVEAQINDAEAQRQKLLVGFYREMLCEVKGLIPARVKAITALRKDLELQAVPADGLCAYYEQDAEAASKAFEELVAAI